MSVYGKDAQDMAEWSRFLRSFLRSPREVGAVLPTSGRAVRALLDLAPVERAGCVVEMGAGTGPYTREIARRLAPDARFLAFEIDPQLAAGLEHDLDDPRVLVLAESAERMAEHLGGQRADVIVSAIPFTSLPPEQRDRLLDAARANLAPGGTFLVLQYSPFMQGRLQRVFESVRRRIEPVNLPPAFLFACHTPEAVRSAR